LEKRRRNNRPYHDLKFEVKTRMERLMRTSGIGDFRLTAGKIMMGLILAALIGSINVAPARGDDDYRERGRHDNGRYEKERGREHDRGRHEKRRRYDRRYVERERVYVPPPVFYAPPPPPGVEIFLPRVIIRP
jgi:hypothetical protein